MLFANLLGDLDVDILIERSEDVHLHQFGDQVIRLDGHFFSQLFDGDLRLGKREDEGNFFGRFFCFDRYRNGLFFGYFCFLGNGGRGVFSRLGRAGCFDRGEAEFIANNGNFLVGKETLSVFGFDFHIAEDFKQLFDGYV